MFDIEEIKSPDFIKNLDSNKLKELAEDIRNYMIINTSKTGGYLLDNLSSVEIEIGVYYIFKANYDCFLFDSVGLGYTHKILTGRAKQFKLLRHQGGLSSNINDKESIYDTTNFNHSSNALGIANGIVIANELNEVNKNVVVLFNRDVLYEGSTLEALYHIGLSSKKIIMILNDNLDDGIRLKFSSKLINNVRNSKEYINLKNDFKHVLEKNETTKSLANALGNFKDGLKEQFIKGGIFNNFNINYYGPIDGHNLNEIIKALSKAKLEEGPVLLHMVTKKGKGYDKFENNDSTKLSLIEPFNIETGKELVSTPKGYYRYEDLIASKIDRLMINNDKIVFITTSNINNNGLKGIFAKYPKRAINLENLYAYAIDVAYGLAKEGFHPILEIDSGYYRKCFDEIHDLIFNNNIAITLLLSKTGLIQGENYANQGIFDIALNNRFNVVISEGKDGEEIKDLLYCSLIAKCPFVIRYPKGYLSYQRTDFNKLEIGTWTYLNKLNKYDLSIISYGNDVEMVNKEVMINNFNYQVINARFINPIDYKILDELFIANKPICIYSSDYIISGLGDNIIRYANQRYASNNIKIIGISKENINLGTISQMRDELKIDMKSLFKELKELC